MMANLKSLAVATSFGTYTRDSVTFLVMDVVFEIMNFVVYRYLLTGKSNKMNNSIKRIVNANHVLFIV